MSTEIEVSIEIDGRRITLRGPENFIREEVRRVTDLLTRRGQDATAEKASSETPVDRTGITESEKSLIVQKQPTGQAETVAVLAFAMEQAGVKEFGEEEIRRAYIRAGVRPPTIIGQALRDARNKYDFLGKGTKRGYYRLSPHGERTVRFDLPRKKTEVD